MKTIYLLKIYENFDTIIMISEKLFWQNYR